MATVGKSPVNAPVARQDASGVRAVFDNVSVGQIGDDGILPAQSGSRSARVEICGTKQNAVIKFSKGTQLVGQISLSKDVETAKIGGKAILVSSEESSYMFCFSSVKDLKSFETMIKMFMTETDVSVFNQRTEESSAEQYFQFYGYMSQQQNMMQDYIRTSTYQLAMLDNIEDFTDKVVLDVGAGSGILSFFAVQAGARKVYAIEASSMALHCQQLVANNGLEDKITVIAGKVEEVDVPEQVDIIISEPMGYMLFNERMLESFLHAKKWLKPSGKIFPTVGDLHIAPFTDETLYTEQCSKANFWYQPSFHSVDLTSLRDAAIAEYFRQPIVDTFDVGICLARTHKYTVDFQTAHESDLYNMDIPISYVITRSGTIHGLAFWFDVAFMGSQSVVWLSTAPTQPLTHWYQVRCLLQTPIYVKQGQTVTGKVLLKCNKRQSYDVEISLGIPGTTIKSYNVVDLKNPFFRYTGQPPQPLPSSNPAEASNDGYWGQSDMSGQAAAAAAAAAAGDAVHSAAPAQTLNPLNMAMLNGAMGDGTRQLLQQIAAAGGAAAVGNGIGAGGQSSVIYNNLIPLGNIAPIHPGSIPSPGIVSVNSSQQAAQSRTSVGAGISPILVAQSSISSGLPQTLLGNQYMIGDYMLPSGTSILPISAQSLGLLN